tara:strand:- start:334 stop:1293 length:960 start_codon:yes stop_codon:yes gene_type:complete
MKRALITGINGQDGSYLSELLLEKGYSVHGIVRRHSLAENQDIRIHNLDVETHYGDLLDEISLMKIIKRVKPDEIYNLAAMSHVRISTEMPSFTIKVNSIALLNLIEIIRNFDESIKLYQASSSEMFGNSIDKDKFQRLTTPMRPVSPYGCSKLLAYNIINHYRTAYNNFFCTGILFNHESPRRGINFVTNKVVRTAVEIKKGIRKKLILGNIDSYRDWGHSKDYVDAIYKIMQYKKPENWIVATGNTYSVRDLCKITFKLLGMNYRDYIKQDKKYFRPQELKYLKGDSSKTRRILKWKPKYTFETMIEEMVSYWSNKL